MAIKEEAPARTDSTTEEAQAPGPSLPLDGFSRWKAQQRFIPISREQARLLEIAGRFPPTVHLSPGVSARSNRELHRYIADPNAYRAPVSDAKPVIGRKRSATQAARTDANDDESAARRRRFEQLHADHKARKAAAEGSAKTVGAPKRDMRTVPEDREQPPESGTRPKRSRPAKVKTVETA